MAYKFSPDMPELTLLEIAPKINRVLDLPEQVNDILSLDPQPNQDAAMGDVSPGRCGYLFSGLGVTRDGDRHQVVP
jgi:hypothetical protein